MKTQQLKKHTHHSPGLNKQSPIQSQVMHNNQKGLIRSEEMNLVLVVLEKNTNTAMVDEDYYC